MLERSEINVEVTPEPVVAVSFSDSGPLERRQVSGTILLVEDEGLVRNVTRQVLEAAGYHVLEARTATEALNISSVEPVHLRLLVTDVVLPDRNGLDLASELSSRFSSLKIVFISGYPENVVTRSKPQATGMFYLAKPFSGNCLVKVVRRALAAT